MNCREVRPDCPADGKETEMKKYYYEHRIQYYETDQMQIAHHSNYIRWFEEARTEALKEAGFAYDMIEAAGIIVPVVSVQADYKMMSRFPEDLVIETSVKSYNGIRLVIQYEIREKKSGELRCTGESSHCFLEKGSNKIVSLKKKYPEVHAVYAGMMED